MGQASRAKWERKINQARNEGQLLAHSPQTVGEKIWSWGSIGTLVVFILGVGVALMTSSHPYVADGFFIAGTLLFLIKGWTWEDAKDSPVRQKIAVGALVTIVALAICAGSCYWNHLINSPKVFAVNSPTPPKPHSELIQGKGVREMFDEGHVGEIRLSPGHSFTYTDFRTKKSVSVDGVVLVDSQRQTYTLSFYIPASPLTVDVVRSLARKRTPAYEYLRELLKSYNMENFHERPVPESFQTINNPTPARKVFIYHETLIPLYRRAEIDKLFTAQGLSVEFRGLDYASEQLTIREMKKDVAAGRND